MASATSTRKRKLSEVDADNGPKEAGEEKVLSHAAQRRLRKRQKTEATSSLLEEEVVSKALDNTKKPESGVHSVWIGNLSFKTTPDALKKYLGFTGEEISRIHMPTKALHGRPTKSEAGRGDNKGFAYVDFTTLDAKEVAIAKSEGHLDGRRLLIKDGNDFTGRPEKDGDSRAALNPLTGLTKTARKILSQQKNAPCQTLFLGNLSFETTEDEIAALFGRTHPKQKALSQTENSEDDKKKSIKVRMGTFEDSGKCKGFAFVDFSDTQNATQALTNPRNHSLNGRALVVEYASPDAVRRGQIASERGNNATIKSRASRRPQKSERIAAKLARSGTGTAMSPKDSEHEEDTPLKDKDTVNQAPSHGPLAARSRTQRLKPGALLANAQREKVGIVESTGKKITFDP